MDNSKLKRAIVTAAKKAFEDMAFIDITMNKEDDVMIMPYQILSVSYCEPESGEIVLFLSSGCVRMIVENIYGREWKSLDKEDTCDCLLELLNVLAGNFLRLFYKHSHHHHTTFPKIVPGIPGTGEMDEYNTFYFSAEGELFKVCLKL